VKTWTATYNPFGGVHTSIGTLPTARFPGQWFQSESGLHQNWMRDYDPTTGRYLQADPLGLIDGASVYGYAGQSPLMNMDPTGQCFGPAIAWAPVCAAVAWKGGQFLFYLLVDIYTDEDCYTWLDFSWFVADYFMPGPPIFRGPADKGGGGGPSPKPKPKKPVDRNQPPDHPDFKPDKKHRDLEQIPWQGPGQKGYKDRNGNYWKPIADGHGGSHAPHWEVQYPGGGYRNVYPE
jgi:RHS repeat-associated protein